MKKKKLKFWTSSSDMAKMCEITMAVEVRMSRNIWVEMKEVETLQIHFSQNVTWKTRYGEIIIHSGFTRL